MPFIIVLTQCSGDEEEVNAFEVEIKKINRSMGMNDIRTVQVLALPVKFRGMPEPIPAFGLDDLVSATLEMLPAFIKYGFIAAQKVSKVEKRRACEEIIYPYVRAAQKGFWDKVPLVNVFLTDNNIVKMFQKLGTVYNTVLPPDKIEEVIGNNGVTLDNNFFGLISPVDMGYSKKISALLSQKKEEGFSVNLDDLKKRDRAARMIAFYGYTFVDSAEELWEVLIKATIDDIDGTVDVLMKVITKRLKERKGQVKRR